MELIRVLALDTSTWWGGVALVEGDPAGRETRVVAEARVWVRDSHSARLLPLVDALLDSAGWSRESLSLHAAVRGPGSFTGVRIGLGMLRGLVIASGRPCVGVDTLEAMAEARGPSSCDRLPLLDAGRGEVYGARYDPAGSPPRVLDPPWVGSPERAASPSAAAIFGTGAERYEERLRAAGVAGPIGAGPERIAAATGRIAFLRIVDGLPQGDTVSPLYLRPSDAEILSRRP